MKLAARTLHLGIGIALALAGQSCNFSKKDGAVFAISQLNSGGPSVTAFASTVYPLVRANCVSCHGASQSPMFAHANVSTAFNYAINIVSFANPELSTMVRKIRDGHCGIACSTDGSQLIALIDQWRIASAAGGSPGGEDIRLGNIITAELPVPAPSPALCRGPADLACTSDGLNNGLPCLNRCWTKLKYSASQMRGMGGAQNTANAPNVVRSWFEIDFAYENYNTESGPASYVLRNPRLISADGPVFIFDAKLWLNGNYRPEHGGAYRRIDTVVDRAIFGTGCNIPASPNPINPYNIGNGCLPSAQPLFSTAASAAGIIQEKTSAMDPDKIAFSFEYYQDGLAGDCRDLNLFLVNVYDPIQRQAVACLDCHKSGGLVSEAGQRFNMDLTDPANGATLVDRQKTVCKKFLQRANFAYPDSSPIITQPTQGLNGMPAQPNFSSFAPDWKVWIEREKNLAR